MINFVRGLGGCFLIIFISCSYKTPVYNPYKKFSPQQLQQDFDLLQNILEERHPGLYWYTPKPNMDSAFKATKLLLKDSLSEHGFRKAITPLIASIQCGHTTLKGSKKYIRYTDTAKTITRFPLSVKIWNDTVVVTANAYQNSPIKKGHIIDSINNKPVRFILDTMYRYIPADGGNIIAKNQILSSTYFGALYISLFGWSREYEIVYKDSFGLQHGTLLKPYNLPKDSIFIKGAKHIAKVKKPLKTERLKEERSFIIDTSGLYATMLLNSFSNGLQLKKFFRQSFKELKKKNINSLIVDLRLNGGGRVSNSNSFIRYLVNKPFKVADSLYAITRHTQYAKYIEHDFWSRFFMRVYTQHKNGQYHLRYFEKKYNTPFKRNHFDGQVFLLSGGLSFSATTLVLNILKPQHNITVLGEASGGAAYGNSAWLIPDVILPNTQLRCRLPLFRLVVDKNILKDGNGVMPEIYVGPTIEAIRKGEDYKMREALRLIKKQD